MRKFILLFLFLIILKTYAYCSYVPANISFIDNASLKTQNIQGIKFNKNNYININDAVKYLNLRYIWEPFTQTIELTDNITLLKQRVLSKSILINDNIHNTDSELLLIDGGLYIPLKILENFKRSVISISDAKLFYKSERIISDKPDDIAQIILKTGQIKLPEIQKSSRSYAIKTIIIDPGHGGVDVGAVGFSKKTYEKNITLAVALKLKQLLEKIIPTARILLTRSTDELLYLEERSQFANKHKGDLFISIHCNAGPPSARGFETFYFSLTEDDETERTARLLENNEMYRYRKQSGKKIDPVDFITTDLAQINHINESIDIANLIQARLNEQISSDNRGARKARFFVLKDTFMPAVLVELGFLTNELEEKLLISDSYQQRLAIGVANAVLEYKNKVEAIKYSITK